MLVARTPYKWSHARGGRHWAATVKGRVEPGSSPNFNTKRDMLLTPSPIGRRRPDGPATLGPTTMVSSGHDDERRWLIGV